ncbi:hypothetical protein BS329_03635 [Amycolatopsis coloradensis]|uniref:Uncharacterized protein n=1 Tax=Amycolatopsis coloradensis TaxID=76021 RepID=A0A1R0KZS0_9PSEU|nr:hypothetical protein [Amycolatopsis coloradensis]OLZ55132.1 hypothetical protein BS329_03635 [Amycolatopsis coloradensis]
MQDRKNRLLWTVLAVVLPGPWTPVVVLAYVLDRAAARDRDARHHDEEPPYPPPDPYACVPVPVSRNRTAPSR